MRHLSWLLLLAATPALALDKQGKRDGADADDTAFNVSASVLMGVAVFNPTYGARPDNSGHALMRYAAHVDVDILGPKLSIPIDVNLFTDRDRPGALVLAPSEFDVIGGITSTNRVGPGDLEAGLRVEHDRPVDTGTFTQTYVDARARYMVSLADHVEGLAGALRGGDVSGWATLGVFAVNPSYAARPDNTGLALFRYGLHAEVSVLDDLVSLGLDACFFTDRTAGVVVPSELDFTPELIFHWAPVELHLAYERDMPIDRGGLVQHFVYLLAAVSFDLHGFDRRAVTDKNATVSP